MIELTLIQLITWALVAIVFGFLAGLTSAALGKSAHDTDESNYWTAWVFTAKSVMTPEQFNEVNKLMEGR